MNEVLNRFKKVEKKLQAQPWFKKGQWLVSVHDFPKAKPEFVTFHVFKKHWFNDEKQGIHIESYLALDPKKRKKSYVTIHVLHYDLIPGTSIKRKVLAENFVDAIYDEVSSWDGYEFRTGKYGTQPFTFNLDGTREDFEEVLEEEVSRLCQYAGPLMDQALKQTLKKT